jgi:hypothetical protein
MMKVYRMRRFVMCAAATAALLPALRAGATINIQFDYTYDSQGFFTTHPEAKATLELAGHTLTERCRDTLTAIAPSGQNDWTAHPFDPGGGGQLSISNPTIPQNTIVVYAGGYVLGGSTLGIGGPGGYEAGGFQDWFDTLAARGQAGALDSPSTDNGPWGGSITFNTTTNWNFALGKGPTNSSQSDFYSVATHELAHLLGFGTSDSFAARISGGIFTGPASGSTAVSPDQGHWASGTKGTVGGAQQEAVMTPSITTGTRKRFSSIDWAGMSDLGWQLARPGDATADGSVDFNDLVALAQNYNVADGQRRWAQGDFNYDGNVDFNDLVSLAQNYNTSEAAAVNAAALGGAGFAADWRAAEALAASSVPEPGVGMLGAVAVGYLLRRRRSRVI